MYLQSQAFIFILLLLTIVCQATGETWDYHESGPDVWSEVYGSCGTYSQSPIVIKTACTVYRNFTPFDFSSAYHLKHDFTLINNGHTIVGTYNGNDSSPFNLTGGGLNGTFQFYNFHLHWGENARAGSEHQVNGEKYASEVHFVHMNPVTKEIAVLGIFMNNKRNTNNTNHTNSTNYTRRRRDTTNDSENITITEWHTYFDTASNLKQKNNSTVLSLNLASLMGSHLNNFWRYRGSLTTPPCTEGIIWTVFKTPITFHEHEISIFRKHIVLKNYRHPQPLHQRMVYRNFLNETLSSIPDYNCCSISSKTYNLNYTFKLLNNGHTIVGTYNGNDSSPFILTGGGLNGTFEFSNFHLHWAENSKSGSEHQVNGVKLTGEIHFVHINPETKVIAVLGIFMHSSQNTSTNETIHTRKRRDTTNDSENITITEWRKYFATASNLQEINNSAVLSLNLASLMGSNLNDFWRYRGSLTTPPCTEGVIWTVFKTPINFSENEMNSFRKNISLDNYRSPQALYNRMVYRNFLNETLSSIPDYNCCPENWGNSSNSASKLLNENVFSLIFLDRLRYLLFIIIVLFHVIIP
ncbi:unnamed protein product [Rotaria sp. Silwood1]|nr:unnamed protein product [Rotaria sp. Silwood1]